MSLQRAYTDIEMCHAFGPYVSINADILTPDERVGLLVPPAVIPLCLKMHAKMRQKLLKWQLSDTYLQGALSRLPHLVGNHMHLQCKLYGAVHTSARVRSTVHAWIAVRRARIVPYDVR